MRLAGPVKTILKLADALFGLVIMAALAAFALIAIRVELADGSDNPQDYALGFRIRDVDGRRVVSHGGGSVGGASWLGIFPNEQVVVAFVTNSTATTSTRNLRSEALEIATWFMSTTE